MDRRTLLKASVAATAGGLLPAAAGAFTSSASAAPRVDRVLATGLEVPWGVAFLPHGDALVSERESAQVFRVARGGGKSFVGVVPGVAGGEPGEGGLLGLAVSPGFASDRWLYAYISTAEDNKVLRMKYENGTLGAPQVLLELIPNATSHHGGRLMFLGGLLYATTGDAGNAARARDTDDLAGKILRMTPSGGVPPDNPFGNYTYSYGHRNVEGIDVDGTGRLWATEFGSSNRDELNRIVKGHDYGWDGTPGSEGGDGPGGHHDPLVSWPNEICSPAGVAIAKGRAWVGALRGQSLWSVDLNGANKRRKTRHFHGRFGRIRTVQKAPDGSLWITTSNRDGRNPDGPNPNDDKVIRITI